MIEPGLFLLAAAGGPKPAVAYIRKSTTHRGHSTERQLDHLKEFAARHGFKIGRVFADRGQRGEPR